MTGRMPHISGRPETSRTFRPGRVVKDERSSAASKASLTSRYGLNASESGGPP